MKLNIKTLVFFWLITIAVTFASCATKTGKHAVTHTPFTGSLYDYEYTMEGRDGEWEKDVVFFAHSFLYGPTGHPLLVDKLCDIFTENAFWGGAVANKRQTFYDEALRKLFIDRINALIDKIPELEDYEILYGLKEIVVLLGDIHSDILVPEGKIFPFYFVPFYDDGFYLCNVRAPKDYERTLLCRLTAINGVATDEILERLKIIISHESEYTVVASAVDVYTVGALYRKEALQYIGVIGDEDTAEFTFIDSEGELFTIEATPVTLEEYQNLELVRRTTDRSEYIMYSRSEQNYWYEYFPDENMMYMRYSECLEMNDFPSKQFVADINETLRETSGVEKFVVDIRGNPGGFPMTYFAEFVATLENNKDIIGTVYVLIDEKTTSGGIITASILRKHVENAVLLGSPGGQPPNFFASASRGNLPISGSDINVSSDFFSIWPDYESDTLLPDVFIYQTLDDYINNRDTVLETIKNY